MFILRSKIKHSSPFIQININPHNKVLFTSVLTTWYSMSTFNKKSQDMPNARKKTHSEKKMQSLEPDSHRTQMLELLRGNLK